MPKKTTTKPTKTKEKVIRKNNKGTVYKELSTPQRLAILEWLAEGCNNKEVFARAENFKPKFIISAQSLYAYRKRYAEPLAELRERNEHIALNTGLALKAQRLIKLTKLAESTEKDLYDKKKIWLQDKKMVGEEEYDFEKYNVAQVQQLREIYNDIAKETGGRVIKTDITSGDKPIKGYVGISPDEWDKEKKENK